MFVEPKYRRSTGEKVYFSNNIQIAGAMAGEWMLERVSRFKVEDDGIACEKIFVENEIPAEIASSIPEYEADENGFVLDIGEVTHIYAGEKALHTAFATLEQLCIEGLTKTLLWDKPFCALRGYRLYTPAREQIELFKQTIDMLEFYRFNAVIVEVGAAMEYKSHPEINESWIEFCKDMRSKSGRSLEIQEQTFDWQKNSIHADNCLGGFLSQDEMREIVEYCKEHGIEVIPEMPSLSHSDYLLLPHPELAERAEDPYPDTYCPSNPKTYELLFDLLEEVIDVFKPSIVNIGHDEYYSIGLCDHCKNTPAEELFAGDIIKIHDFLAERGVKTMMWGDKLLNNFPHRLNNEWLEFDVGGGDWYELCNRSQIIFEPHFRTVRRKTGDSFWIKNITSTDEKNVYRFWLHGWSGAEAGDILVLRHNERYHAGIFTERCKNILFDNITVHSCGGLGCLSQFCEDITYKQMHFIPDRSLGRVITGGRDDGMNITCNKGKITITECTFIGLMDDPINVHGCSVTADEVISPESLKCHYRHKQAMGFLYWASKGDEIAFIDRNNMSRIASFKVNSYNLENRDTFTLDFEDELPEYILKLVNSGAVALENLTNTAEVVCTKNRFGSCRARGMLISTPKPVLIENNYFESSGSAILVAGDANNWFESGECNEVVIRNNTFTNACLTSDYEFCQGIISICPTIPNPEVDKPFHKNIKIENNVFDTSDTQVLYAYSCKNLEFSNNLIFKSNAAEKWHSSSSRITLSYCVDSKIENNTWVGKFEQENVLTQDNCKNIKA